MNAPEPMRPASDLTGATPEPFEGTSPVQRHHLHFFVQDAGEGRAILRLSPSEDRQGRSWDCRTTGAAERVALRYAASVAGESGLARVVIESEQDRHLWDVSAAGPHPVPAQHPGSSSGQTTSRGTSRSTPPPTATAQPPLPPPALSPPPSSPPAPKREVEDPWVSKPRRLKVVPPLPAQAEPLPSQVDVSEAAQPLRTETPAADLRDDPSSAPTRVPGGQQALAAPRSMQEQLLASRNRLAGASARVPQPDWDSIVKGTDPTPAPAALPLGREPRPSDLPTAEVVVRQTAPGTTSVVVDPVVTPVIKPEAPPGADASRWVVASAVSAPLQDPVDQRLRGPLDDQLDDQLDDDLVESEVITTGPMQQPARSALLSAPTPQSSPASQPAPEPLTSPAPAALPAQRGWRGLLVRAGLRVSPGAAERSERADHAAARRFWTGPRTIAVVNPKGGAGRTPTTAMLAAVFARHGGAVVAWDAAAGAGTLGWRTQHRQHDASAIDLRDRLDDFLWTDARASDLMSFVHHQDEDLYDVLPGRAMAAGALAESWSAADVAELHGLLATYYRLVVVDTGASAEDPAWQAAVAAADQLVVVATPHPAVIASGRRLLEALTHRGGHHAALARSAVGVLTEAEPGTHRAAVAAAASGQLLPPEQVSVVPHDPAMVDGVLTYDRLHRRTRRAWLRAAAMTAAAMPEHSDVVVGDLA